MPCRDYDYGTSVITERVENPINEKMKIKLNLVTRLLCFVLTHLTKRRPDTLYTLLNLKTKESSELRGWWLKHQEEDRQRLEDEQREQNRIVELKRKQAEDKILRQQALSKLSDAEKKILNIK